MLCKYCSYPETCVMHTEKQPENNLVYRRRMCLRCGKRFSTQENLKNGRKPRRH